MSSSINDLIHIKLQSRTGCRPITTITGLSSIHGRPPYGALDFKSIIRQIKTELSCNATIVKDVNDGIILQLQGDKRQQIYDFLIRESIHNGMTITID